MTTNAQLMIQFGSAAKRYLDALQLLAEPAKPGSGLGPAEDSVLRQAHLRELCIDLKRQLVQLMDTLTPFDGDVLKRQTTSRRAAIERLTRFTEGSLLVASRDDVRDLLELARLAVSIANDVTDELTRITAKKEG